MMRRFYLLLTGLCISFVSLTTLADSQTMDDIAYRSALYAYQLKHYQKAELILDQALQAPKLEQVVYYKMLLARVYVELHRYQDAQQIFQEFDLSKVPLDLRNHTLFALAKLYFAKDRCKEALDTLNKTQRLPDDQDVQARYMKTSCMVQNAPTLETLNKAQAILDESVADKQPADEVIWFAYAYYNLALAAGQLKEANLADELYNKALDYTGSSKEGLALTQKIRLSQGNVYYAMNRYDYAMDAYSKIPLDSYWQDQALLGYGWAAFNNHKPGIALEAWRQLINLPYKSMEVYQGYLLIPFAQERANAFLTALKSYEDAVEQYNKVTNEIDDFDKKLSIATINDYAVRYYHRDGRVIAPLHPLLAATYTQMDFRDLIEKIGVLTGYQQQLQDYQQEVDLLLQYQAVFQQKKPERKQWLAEHQKSTQQAVDALSQQLLNLRQQIMDKNANATDYTIKNRADYQQYLQLSEQVKSAQGEQKQVLQAQLQRLQQVLFYALSQDKKAQAVTPDVQVMIDRLQALSVRFNEYKQYAQQEWHDQNAPDVSALKGQIGQSLKAIDGVLLDIEQQLLAKTRQALADQRQQIEVYKNQARTAVTSLKEEFYQRGGSRLWY